MVLLAATAGSTDAWSYFGLGHVFIANMTGNTVLLGVALSHLKVAEVARPALAILSYLCGVFVGTALLETIFGRWGPRTDARPEAVWPRRISWLLSIESVMLIAGGLTWARYGGGNALLRHGLVCTAAVALGLQSAAMQSLKLPGIVTTYITGTWTTLAAGLARVATGKTTVETPHAHLRMQAAVLFAYCASAVVSGILFRLWSPGLGILPAAAVTFVTMYGAWRPGGRESA